MKATNYRVEYETQLKEGARSDFYVCVREDHILPCCEIESEYVDSLSFDNREDAESEWNNLREKYEKELLRGKGGILDHQNWIDGTSEIVEISINDGEFHLPSD